MDIGHKMGEDQKEQQDREARIRHGCEGAHSDWRGSTKRMRAEGVTKTISTQTVEIDVKMRIQIRIRRGREEESDEEDRREESHCI